MNLSVNNAGTIFVLKSNVLWQMISWPMLQLSVCPNHAKVILYRVGRYLFSVRISLLCYIGMLNKEIKIGKINASRFNPRQYVIVFSANFR